MAILVFSVQGSAFSIRLKSNSFCDDDFAILILCSLFFIFSRFERTKRPLQNYQQFIAQWKVWIQSGTIIILQITPIVDQSVNHFHSAIGLNGAGKREKQHKKYKRELKVFFKHFNSIDWYCLCSSPLINEPQFLNICPDVKWALNANRYVYNSEYFIQLMRVFFVVNLNSST